MKQDGERQWKATDTYVAESKTASLLSGDDNLSIRSAWFKPDTEGSPCQDEASLTQIEESK